MGKLILYRCFILFKMILFRIWVILKMEFIKQLWRGKKELIVKANTKLVNRDLMLRKQLYDIFRRYKICTDCQGYCCYARANKFNFNDCYLYGHPLIKGLSPEFNLTYLFKSSPRVIRFIFTRDKKYNTLDNKCEFLSEKGCVLTMENMPNICVLFICSKLLREMSALDMFRYSSLINKNFRLQNEISYALIKGLIFSQEGAVTR